MPALDRHRKVDKDNSEEKDVVRGIDDVIKSKEFEEAVERTVKKKIEETQPNLVPWITTENQPWTVTYSSTTGGDAHDKKG